SEDDPALPQPIYGSGRAFGEPLLIREEDAVDVSQYRGDWMGRLARTLAIAHGVPHFASCVRAVSSSRTRQDSSGWKGVAYSLYSTWSRSGVAVSSQLLADSCMEFTPTRVNSTTRPATSKRALRRAAARSAGSCDRSRAR